MGSFKLGKMTLGGLFKKPETLMYPVETKTPPAGLKGHVVNDVDRCILCGICQKRCPCAAIVVDKPARTWTIDRFRCVQCGSCVRECPKDCLTMEPTYTPPRRASTSTPSRFRRPRKRRKASSVGTAKTREP